MPPRPSPGGEFIEIAPLVVLSQTFPARPSAIPKIREFVRRCLIRSPLAEGDSREIAAAVSRALLDAAGPTGAVQVSFRVFEDHVEVDFLRSGSEASIDGPAGAIDRDLAASTRDANRPASTVAADGAASTDEPDRNAAAGHTDEPSAPSFAAWMSAALRREGLTMDAAARQLGVSVKTVGRWVGGTTEPRMRELRRIREVFGEVPIS